MLKFKNIHIYCNQANTLNFNVIVPELQKYFTNIAIDVRHTFLNNINNVLAESLVSISISDIKKPFNEQPKIQIQRKSDQDVAYEKNFPRYITPNGTSNSDSSTKG
jgi:DNA-directed RNA polymerase subunit L